MKGNYDVSPAAQVVATLQAALSLRRQLRADLERAQASGARAGPSSVARNSAIDSGGAPSAALMARMTLNVTRSVRPASRR
jgi:hypothetical protein